MKYTKPSVTLLGNAIRVIKSSSPKSDSAADNQAGGKIHTQQPAYDLDE